MESQHYYRISGMENGLRLESRVLEGASRGPWRAGIAISRLRRSASMVSGDGCGRPERSQSRSGSWVLRGSASVPWVFPTRASRSWGHVLGRCRMVERRRVLGKPMEPTRCPGEPQDPDRDRLRSGLPQPSPDTMLAERLDCEYERFPPFQTLGMRSSSTRDSRRKPFPIPEIQ